MSSNCNFSCVCMCVCICVCMCVCVCVVGGALTLVELGEELFPSMEEWRRTSAGENFGSELLGSISVVTRAWPGGERVSKCVRE